MNGNGAWTSAEFVIDKDVGERRYIDITWNPVSGRFFVGYNVIGDRFKECSVRQAAITSSGTVTFVRTVNSVCDPLHGGHRSSSSTDDNLVRNPTGQYLWYFQSSGPGNQVHLMNNAGDVVAALDLGQGPMLSLPVPVALANVHEAAGPSYAVSVHFVGAFFEHPYAFLTLAANGSVVSTQPRVSGEALGAEALANKVVTATGVLCAVPVAGMCQSWFISVYDL